jgi:hypothetical protein
LSAGIPRTIAELIHIAKQAKHNNELHLAFVTGVPGSGKTLVGIQPVYENHLIRAPVFPIRLHKRANYGTWFRKYRSTAARLP